MSAAATKFDFDLLVLGGGSGGLAVAKEAAKLEKKVGCFDFVDPSPHGTKWGLGGTCVNVGCIPKRLMHFSGMLGESFLDARALGWKLESKVEHDWPKMVTAINNYIRSLNFSYRTSLRSAGVQYFNAKARFVDDHTIEYGPPEDLKRVTSERFVVATGGRPSYPDIPGAELGISSDDIFWQKKAPGKTLVVGGSYIALECAGFLHALGYDVTVMVRSILLRGFDQQVAQQIGEVMEWDGVRFLNPVVPKKLHRAAPDGPITVTYGEDNKTEDFDTVLFAIGRKPNTHGIGLEAAKVELAPNGKILVDEGERSSVPHIYAIGDVITCPSVQTARPELTPVAIQAGHYLARRLFGGAETLMDYNLIPTTVFTPLEYGACGMSEEEAIAKFGADNVDVFVSRFNTLDTAPSHRSPTLPTKSQCWTGTKMWARGHALAHGQEWVDAPQDSFDYEDIAGKYSHNRNLGKLVVNKADGNRVVGFHYLGPNAGDTTQGFALAIRMGATKADFDAMVGIHPTLAEEFTVMETTVASGKDFVKKEGCGGGGSCG